MKRFLQISALAFLVMLGSAWRNKASAQVDVDISYQTFYDELSPYGEWVDYPEYGYCWVPAESAGFQPYETNGHWVWTDDYEWMWVSDYSWGWAPFHYGRWFMDPDYGWMWAPGYEWSPAWVAWRDGGDYYGWAPLRPGINIGIGFSIGSYNPPVDYWCFAPRQYISSPRIYDYCLDRGRNVTIINNTTIINNYNRRNNVFVTGPRRVDAERYAGRINPVRFREAARPGRTQFRNNEVSVYRPRVQRDNNRQFAPSRFERFDRNRGGSNGNVARGERNNGFSRNGNNLPEGRDNNRFNGRNNSADNNNDNRRFERRNDQQGNIDQRMRGQRNDMPQQQQPNDNRRFDRGNNNAMERQQQQRQFDQQRQQMEQRQNQQRQFDQQRQMERQQQPSDNRRFDRGNNGAFERQQMERQQQSQREQQQNQQRQFDQQRQVERQQQMERQQAQRQQMEQRQNQQRQFDQQRQVERQQQMQQRQQQQQQSQSRQFERRQDNQPRQSENRGGGNDNGRGHGRRF